MKTSLELVSLGVALIVVCGTQALAQTEPGNKKAPTSKLYLSETKGPGHIYTGGKIFEPKQATAFDAPGTIIETETDAHQAYVYSNGTGMFVDANTRVEVNRFVQEPFQADRNTTETEPSVSQSDIFIWHGLVGVCTSQLVSGSTMTYTTAHAAITIRGRKIAILTSSKETIVYLLDGDVTVRTSGKDLGGQVLKTGERAIIRPGAAGQPPVVNIGPIEPDQVNKLDDKVTLACNARRTVSFETIERKAEFGATGQEGNPPEEIVPRPTVSQTPNVNIVVSPSQL